MPWLAPHGAHKKMYFGSAGSVYFVALRETMISVPSGGRCTQGLGDAFCMILQAFWPPKLAKSGLGDAPQQRGYTRSLPMGPIDGRKTQFWMRSAPEWCRGYPPLSLTVGIRKSSKMQEIMPDTVQEWHAEEVIFEAFWIILQAFWPPQVAKSCLKDAPQRRGYTRSLPMDPIDGTH
eukprot:gene25391-biopygen15027